MIDIDLKHHSITQVNKILTVISSSNCSVFLNSLPVKTDTAGIINLRTRPIMKQNIISI